MKIGNIDPWIISDMHLNHKSMVTLCGRPFSFTEDILDSLKGNIKENDILIDLGDVIFRDTGMLKQYLEPVLGKKILVRGNHDKQSITWYMENGYDFVCDQFVWDDVVFSHTPLPVLPEGCLYNIHGHLHNNTYDNPYDQAHRSKKGLPLITKQPWHFLLALEEVGYGPIRLKEFLEKKIAEM